MDTLLTLQLMNAILVLPTVLAATVLLNVYNVIGLISVHLLQRDLISVLLIVSTTVSMPQHYALNVTITVKYVISIPILIQILPLQLAHACIAMQDSTLIKGSVRNNAPLALTLTLTPDLADHANSKTAMCAIMQANTVSSVMTKVIGLVEDAMRYAPVTQIQMKNKEYAFRILAWMRNVQLVCLLTCIRMDNARNNVMRVISITQSMACVKNVKIVVRSVIVGAIVLFVKKIIFILSEMGMVSAFYNVLLICISISMIAGPVLMQLKDVYSVLLSMSAVFVKIIFIGIQFISNAFPHAPVVNSRTKQQESALIVLMRIVLSAQLVKNVILVHLIVTLFGNCRFVCKSAGVGTIQLWLALEISWNV